VTVTDGVGVGDAFFRFDFAFGVALGDRAGETLFFLTVAVADGVGEAFLGFGEAVGDGLGVDFPVARFRCFRAGVGVGVASKTFLIFVPNDSSAASGAAVVPAKIATVRKSRSIALIAGNKDQPASS